MKRLTLSVLFVLIFAVIFSGSLAAAQKQQTVNAPKAAAPVVKELPFYFPVKILAGVTDPVRQHAEYQRYLRATEHCFQGTEADRGAMYLAKPDSIRIPTNIVSTSSPAHSGQKMVIVLDNFVRVDGVVRYSNLCEVRTITDHELDVVVKDLTDVVATSIQANYDKYKRFHDLAFAARAEALKTTAPELAKWIDLKDPHYNITYRDMQLLPYPVKASDFVPYELHLGLNTDIQGILGVTWLNTGLIYYNPQARFFDYLVGKPVVMQHEMIHVNSNLQRLPLTEAFDAETFACFPAMIYPENQISMFFHGYTTDMRQLSRVYFGFDFNEAKKRIFKFDFAGPVDADEVVYRQYALMVDKIKAEWMTFMENIVIPQFYQDPMWWGALHQTLNVKNAVIKIMMAVTYDPTLLGGREKTMAWIAPRSDEFMKVAEDIFMEMKNQQSEEGSGEDAYLPRVPQFLFDAYERMFSSEERSVMESYVRAHPDVAKRLKKWDWNAAFEVYRNAKKAVKGDVK